MITLTILKKLILVVLLLAFAAIVSAHSLYLFDISLDFDQQLKSDTIKAAKEFLNTDKDPVSFDLDKGLIIAHFEPEQRNYVEVNPIWYKVNGMRNENLMHTQEGNKITKEQGYETAKKVFESLPKDVQSELKYSPLVSEVDGAYFYKWFRYVNNIIVAGEDFYVNVDAFNANVIAWRLSVFDYPEGLIVTTPAITANIARKVAEISFKSPSVKGFEPYLIINGNEPVWVIKLQGEFYPFYVGVSAADGSINFMGVLPGELPDGYSVGKNIKVVENNIIKKIYKSK